MDRFLLLVILLGLVGLVGLVLNALPLADNGADIEKLGLVILYLH